MSVKKQIKKRFIVADIETDPFRDWSTEAEQFVPRPFCCGLYDGKKHSLFWGEDCAADLVSAIRKQRADICYFHNGGNFDFHFLLPHLDAPRCGFLLIGSKRIVRIVLPGRRKIELRDSYALVPKPLKAWDKDAFDYSLMERGVRARHKEKILEYLRHDLESLYDMVSAARERNDRDPLTLASASFSKLRKSMEEKFPCLSESTDNVYRKFYFAGRVTASTRGKAPGAWDCYDINSAFPHAMLSRHAWGGDFHVTTKRPGPRRMCQSFVEITCHAKGCFPLRTPDGVSYPTETGTYYVTGWEYVEAVRLRLVSRITREVWHVPTETRSYRKFVIPLYREKLRAEKVGDSASRLFSKLELNGAYGKTGQDPRKFRDVKCVRIGDFPRLRSGKRDMSWELAHDDESSGLSFFERPTHSGAPGSKLMRFYNVAVAASITGLVRARLLRAMVKNKAIYCDTDSIFVPAGCRAGLEIGSELGQWKHEFRFSRLWIAGKKLYAGQGHKPGDPALTWKIASKGVRLAPEQIAKVATGKTVVSRFAAPSFSLLTGTRFIQRKAKKQPIK